MCDESLHDDEEDLTVTCCRCATVFEAMSPTQASGCAADVHEDGIYGHYGSTVCDMTRLVYTGERSAVLVPGEQVCDSCLTEMLAEGLLREDEYHSTGLGDAAAADTGDFLDPSEWEEMSGPPYAADGQSR